MGSSEVIIYISKAQLVKVSGKDYEEVLRSLIDQTLLNSFEDVIALKFDKDKSLSIQVALEFYDVQSVLPGKTKQPKQED